MRAVCVCSPGPRAQFRAARRPRLCLCWRSVLGSLEQCFALLSIMICSNFFSPPESKTVSPIAIKLVLDILE